MNKINFKNKKPPHEHSSGKDRYLITYADLITLLLGLFVILYASSQVDSEKFSEMSQAFTKYFKNQPAQVLQGGDGVLEGNKRGVPEPMLLPTSNKSLETVEKEATQALSSFVQKGLVQLKRSGNNLVIVLPEKLLFKSAKADIQPEGLTVIDTLSGVLRSLRFVIMVDGHTDSKPIRTFQYESNWHLSVARALSVGYRMIRSGVPEENFVLRGFGAQRPVKENSTADGKAGNRRVEITISQLNSDLPAKTTDSTKKTP